MRLGRLLIAGLRQHARALAGVAIGSAIATAVLSGALVVGDSVRASLRTTALERIGRIDVAMAAHDRFFRADLGDPLAFAVPGLQAAPLIALDGVAITDGGASRVNDARVYGIDDRFLDLALEPISKRPLLRPHEAIVSAAFARRLDLAVGDDVVVRVEKPSGLPRDMALATTDDLTVPLRYTVFDVLADGAGGRFDLAANQVAPASIFVARAHLAEALGLRGRANLLIVHGPDGDAPALAAALNGALPHVWSLDDGELDLVARPDRGVAELRSRRVFIDPPVETAIRALDYPALGILTYFVNGIRHGERTTPYSTVAAVGPLAGAPSTGGFTPPAPGSITLTDWCADDIGAAPGDAVDVRAFVIGASRRLDETTESFTVDAVVPMTGFVDDPDLMPAFPGLADSAHCRDWEAGIPIDLEQIRDQDEAYWNDHRGTPKAFIALADGQRLWGSRFGGLTAVRVPLEQQEAFGDALRAAVAPSELGLRFRDVRTPALAASAGTTDFGGLFIGLSLFLIVSAVVLTALLFAFAVESRTGEVGLLLAVGFRPRTVRRLFLGEAAVLAAVGAVIGMLGAILYAQLVLRGLGGVWSGAVAGVRLDLVLRPATIVGGAVGAALVAFVAIWLALRKQVRRPAAELLQPGAGSGVTDVGPWRRRARIIVAPVATVAAATLALTTDAGRGPAAAGAFFGAGTLVLIAGMAACGIAFDRIARTGRRPIGTVRALGVRSAVRRPGRSLAVVLLVAAGTFLVVAVGANRLGALSDPTDPASGTGGFTLMGTSALPVLQDPSAAEGQDAYGIDAAAMDGVSVVPLRVRDGDEASCLNLNVAQQPRLLGVDPAAFAERGAFTFAATGPGLAHDASPWTLLDSAADAIPAIGDQASLQWALHKSIGDEIEYVDERGETFRVRIVGAVTNSILQGNLVIARSRFEARYPSEAGARMLLVDAPIDRAADVSAALTRGMSDLGMAVESTADRLAAFSSVQNTYLLIFQVLGGLGLVLGSAGLAIVVLRNVLERRGELAALRAIGWRRREILRLVASEHGLLLGIGLLVGIVAAGLAVLPAVRGPGLEPSWTLAGSLVLAVAAVGLLSTWVASWAATRASALEALRAE